ncbi:MULTISPECIES: hypothetical protein [Mesorhizobium]|uniref:hypothetical protein n=1 Tax=Mesorhizobium TaxID=68287 RepID=UPI001FEAAD0C|nr:MULTISPECIES: hypothetical protein [Mesorhizobium]
MANAAASAMRLLAKPSSQKISPVIAIFLLNQFLPRRDEAVCPNTVHQGERLMFTVSRNVLLAAIAVSMLAGCKTTAPRECDRLA